MQRILNFAVVALGCGSLVFAGMMLISKNEIKTARINGWMEFAGNVPNTSHLYSSQNVCETKRLQGTVVRCKPVLIVQGADR